MEHTQNDQTYYYVLSSSCSRFLLYWGASGKMARNKLVSPKETFKELSASAGFLQGSWDTGRKRAEGCIPCCSPLPYNTFPESSSASQSLPKCAFITLLGQVQWPKARSVGVLKLNRSAEAFKNPNYRKIKGWDSEISSPGRKHEVVEVSASPPNLSHDSPVHKEAVFQQNPSLLSLNFPVSMGAHAQPSHNQDKSPRHWISCRTSPSQETQVKVNFAMKSATTDQSLTLDATFVFCKHEFHDETLCFFWIWSGLKKYRNCRCLI